MFWLLDILFFINCIISVTLASAIPTANEIEQGVHCKQQQKLEVLPGWGWDSLRSMEMDQILKIRYSKCKTTEDGIYLIPDDVHATPLKISNVQLLAEIIDHWKDYKSVTAKSFEAHAGASYGPVSVSGSYGEDYQDTKERQVGHHASTVRVTAKHAVYDVKASTSSQINDNLMTYFWDALGALGSNRPDKTDLILELIIRDFGTHYITTAQAGAMLVQEDSISKDFQKNSNMTAHTVTIGASIKFQLNFGVDAGVKWSQTKKDSVVDSYSNFTSSSHLKTLGGAMMSPNTSSHNTLDEWIKSLVNNLVTVDRIGEPISFLITPARFPNIPLEILEILRNRMDNAIKRYFTYNTHKGCMEVGDRNFDISANVDDGTCDMISKSYSLGGIYQLCQSITEDAGNLCDNLIQINQKTGNFTCPSGYDSIHIHHNTVSKVKTEEKCKECNYWILTKLLCHDNCKEITKTSEATYDTYWCVSFGKSPSLPGFMFGGLYTSTTVNPVTNSMGCPTFYSSVKFGLNLTVCLSDDDQGKNFSKPFGGFFTCSVGNPLMTNGTSPYIYGCPAGYSQHTATIVNGCEINYCISAGAFGNKTSLPLKRPPFTDISYLYVPTMGSQSLQELFDNLGPQSRDKGSLTGGAIAGIVIACFVVVASILGIVYFRRRKKEPADRHELTHGSAYYGPSNSSA